MSSGSLISLRSVSKRYEGSTPAVDAVDLDIKPHEVFGLIGANGSGKSTLLKMMAGVFPPSSGEVSPNPTSMKKKIGYASQDEALDPEMTVDETLRLFAALYDVPLSSPTFNLSEFRNKTVAKLSGGQRQRLHLAIAFLQDPSILLLDEPTTGIDPGTRKQLWDHLHSWINTQRSAVVATHDLKDAEDHFDRVAVMASGKILVIDKPEAICAAHARPRLEVICSDQSEISPEEVQRLKAQFDLESTEIRGNSIQLRFKREGASVDSILNQLTNLKVVETRLHAATFEEAFFALTGYANSETRSEKRERKKRRAG
jgi:ABC-2 type transport system ATP-binding protein